MLSRRSLAALGALTVVAIQACASAPPPVASPPATSTVVREKVAPVVARRGPSEALRAHWTFDENAEVSIYVDVAALLRSPLAAVVLPQVMTTVKESLNAQQLQCLNDVVASGKEILVGQRDDTSLTLVRFDESVAKPMTCLATAGAVATEVAGATDAYRAKDGLIVHLPGLLVMGTDEDILRAVHQTTLASPSTVAKLALDDDEYLAWTAAEPGVGSARGGLFASLNQFRLDLDADLPEPLARRIDGQVAEAKTASSYPGASPAETAMLKSLLADVSVKRDGRHVLAAFTLDEAVTEQARDLLTATVVGIARVRQYITVAKTAEARAVTQQIAKDYVAYWADADAKTGKKTTRTKLVSFAPVPVTIPSGVKYASQPADWKPWEALRFAMSQPQYFQYEVRASKDGKSADILARGDLNGNGKASLFRLHLHVDPKDHSLHVDPKIEETDPEE